MARESDVQVDLLGPADVRRLAGDLGLRPTKTRGQNFVTDPGTVRRIVRTADVQPGEQVLEVGPGLGSLTLALLEAGARVTAVEIDPLLADRLPRTVADRMHPLTPQAPGHRSPQDTGESHPSDGMGTVRPPDGGGEPPPSADVGEVRPSADVGDVRLRVVTADALTVRDLPGPAPVALVANLPYNVAVPLVLTLLERLPSLDRLLVMVQSEVADRLVAAPGTRTYGAPTVKTAWYGTARRAGAIGRRVFWPVPNVDSALVAVRRTAPPTTRAGRGDVFACIEAAFAQRRKTLRAALAGWAGSPDEAGRLLRAAGIDPTWRGERLTVADFARLAEARGPAPRGEGADVGGPTPRRAGAGRRRTGGPAR